MSFIAEVTGRVERREGDLYVVRIEGYQGMDKTVHIRHNPDFAEQKAGNILFVVVSGIFGSRGIAQESWLFGARLSVETCCADDPNRGPVYYDSRRSFKAIDKHELNALETMLYRGDPIPKVGELVSRK